MTTLLIRFVGIFFSLLGIGLMFVRTEDQRLLFGSFLASMGLTLVMELWKGKGLEK